MVRRCGRLRFDGPYHYAELLRNVPGVLVVRNAQTGAACYVEEAGDVRAAAHAYEAAAAATSGWRTYSAHYTNERQEIRVLIAAGLRGS
jgi:hypothetical protein